MKYFTWRNEPQWIATAHAESVAQARELLLGEVGGIDGSCVVRAKARQIISEEAPAIWVGPNAEFALTDSAALEEQDAEVTRLRAELASTKTELETVRLAIPPLDDDNEAYRAENDPLRAELAAANERCAELAAALERQADKCRLWRDTFEGLDEDLFSVEAHHDLSAIYDLTDDADAQDTADAILAADRKAQRAKGAAWALRDASLMIVEQSNYCGADAICAVDEAAQLIRDRASAIERGEVEVGE